MVKEDKNPAKLIFFIAFVLVLVFLIVAIDNKLVRILLGATLLISLTLAIMVSILEQKKFEKKQIHRQHQSVIEHDEGFVIKKSEQNLSAINQEKLNPREEFKELLKKVLQLIKKNIVADSVAFYWSNEDKKQMVLEEGITDLGFNFVKRYNWDDDALTVVARTGASKIIGDINPSAEEDVIKYQSPRMGVKSILVHPVTYRNKVVGVLLLDSKQSQTFSDDDLRNVALFSDLISQLIGNYITKFDLYYRSKILDIISDIGEYKLDEILLRVQNFATKVLDCSAVAVVLYEDGKWIVSLGYSKLGRYVDRGTEVKLEGTLVGEVITSGIPKIVSSTRTQNKVIRFNENEKITLESSIAVVPIRYGLKCYGAILFEHPKQNFFASRSDIKKLEDLANILGILLENDALNELVDNYFIYDEETFLMRKNYFYDRLNVEIERKKNHGGEMSLVLLSVDNLDYVRNTYGESAASLVLPYIANIVRNSLSVYDLAGRLEDNLFAIALVETGANEAYIWAEKLRKTISNQEIKYKDTSFSVTITAGISAWDGDKNADELIERVKRNFLKARQTSENVVKVF